MPIPFDPRHLALILGRRGVPPHPLASSSRMLLVFAVRMWSHFDV